MKEECNVLFYGLTKNNVILGAILNSKNIHCVFANPLKQKAEEINVVLNSKTFNFLPCTLKQSERTKLKFNCIIVEDNNLDAKMFSKYLSFLNDGGEIIVVNALKTYFQLSSLNTNVVFLREKSQSEEIENTTTIKSIKFFFGEDNLLSKTIKNSFENISFKKTENYLSKFMSRFIIIESIIKPILFLNSKRELKTLKFSLRIRKQIMELISEDIAICNNNLFTVANYGNFNYYRFLNNAKGFWLIKKHFNLFNLLSRFEKLNFVMNLESSIESVETIIEFGKKNSYETKRNSELLAKLEKLKLKTQEENSDVLKD